jgi:tryptophan synthase alpha subunit
VEEFCKKAKQVGALGLIIPDIPIDEEPYEQFLHFCKKYNLNSIRVLSPTSSDERIEQNLAVAEGFVYCTAISGITGARNELHSQTKSFLQKMRSKTDLPLAVGFGISKPEHIEALVGFADIAVVGSAVIKEVERGGVDGGIALVEKLVRTNSS